jgi:hypothetical protein
MECLGGARPGSGRPRHDKAAGTRLQTDERTLDKINSSPNSPSSALGEHNRNCEHFLNALNTCSCPSRIPTRGDSVVESPRPFPSQVWSAGNLARSSSRPRRPPSRGRTARRARRRRGRGSRSRRRFEALAPAGVAVRSVPVPAGSTPDVALE